MVVWTQGHLLQAFCWGEADVEYYASVPRAIPEEKHNRQLNKRSGHSLNKKGPVYKSIDTGRLCLVASSTHIT